MKSETFNAFRALNTSMEADQLIQTIREEFDENERELIKLEDGIKLKDKKIEALEEEVAELKEEIGYLQEEVSSVENKCSDIEKDLHMAQNALINAEEKIDSRLEKAEKFIPENFHDEEMNKIFFRMKKNLSLEQIEECEKYAKGLVPAGVNYRD